MPKSAPAKKAPAAKKEAAKAAAQADAALDTKPEATEETAPVAEEPTREAAPMQAAAEPTDFDQLLDLARSLAPDFGSDGAKEGTQHFLGRILTALADSTTEQFETLPVSAQTWYENGCAEGNAGKPISEPAGYMKPAAVAKEATAGKKAAEKKAAAPKKERKAAAPKEKKPREASKTMPVRMAVCSNPAITLEQLVALLPAIGKSTLSTTRSDTLATLEAARNSGWTAPK